MFDCVVRLLVGHGVFVFLNGPGHDRRWGGAVGGACEADAVPHVVHLFETPDHRGAVRGVYGGQWGYQKLNKAF